MKNLKAGTNIINLKFEEDKNHINYLILYMMFRLKIN